MLLASYLFSVIAALTPPDTMPNTGILELHVTNIQKNKGRIWIGIYNSKETFLIREKARLVEAEVDEKGELTIPLYHLDYGSEYAFALFHDQDDDGEMNLNWLGLPTEPWAFSGEPKTRLRLPRFEEVKFCFKPGKEQHIVRLRKW